MHRILFLITTALLTLTAPAEPSVTLPGRWPAEKANAWSKTQPWLVGCNFTPSTAINQLEMSQADTFDPETIDRELGWAAAMGMNTVRVYLHDLPWQQDKKNKIGAYNWGLVAGKIQTQYPWASWCRKFTAEPKIWHHDILKPDGTPHLPSEVEFIKSLTKPAKK